MGRRENEKTNSTNSRGLSSTMASPCGNLTPRVGEDLSKSQRNEKKESNEKVLGENCDGLEKKIPEKKIKCIKI